jgi:hypothetical protein
MEMILIFSEPGEGFLIFQFRERKSCRILIRWKNARARNLKGLPISAEFDGSGWFDGIVEDGE